MPGATPSFSDLPFVPEGFGSGPDAGGWRSEGADRSPGGQPGWWAGLGARFLADTTREGWWNVVGFGGPGVYVVRNLHRRFRTR